MVKKLYAETNIFVDKIRKGVYHLEKIYEIEYISKEGENMKVYPLLEKAMQEKGVTRKDLAKLLKVRYATIIDKLKGRFAFTYDEALKIKDTFFNEYDVEELFCRDN